MLLVQEYLQSHSFQQLEDEHAVVVSPSSNKKKISCNYDQIAASTSNPISNECRGLVLAKENLSEFDYVGDQINKDVVIGNTKIIACPFFRFLNHGQDNAAEINWEDRTLTVAEKLDGSLCIVMWDPTTKQWQVGTRSRNEATQLMDNGKFTFRSLFEKALGGYGVA